MDWCAATAAGWGQVVMGVGVYMHREKGLPMDSTVRQLNAALRFGASGVCLFSYGSALGRESAPVVASWNKKTK